VIWPGDLDNGFEVWDDERDGEKLVGGLTSAIHGGTSLSVSGYPFYASDTGGYRGGRPSHESFVRWTEYAATLPIWQYGGAGENHNPWDFTAYGESQFNEDTLAAFRRYATLHTRLWPYYQGLVGRIRSDGVPPVLPQGLGDPSGGVHDAHNFFVGRDLFVAPVVDEGVQAWTGTLPSGSWVHWWSGTRYDGGATVTIDAPLGEGPLFQRVGSVVPLLDREVQTLAPATDPSVRSWVNEPGALNARVIAGPGAAVAVADGAAIAAEDDGDITLTAGALYVGWDVEVYAPGATAVRLDGASLPEGEAGCGSCVVPGEGPWVRVIAAAGDHRVEVE
jgi:alpha-D-xyloside xylohydrolase